MKKTPILLALFFTIIGCSPIQKDPYITKESIAINKILDNYARWVKKRYKIYPIGTAVGIPNGILRIMGVHFQSYGVMSKEEAREIQLLVYPGTSINSSALLMNFSDFFRKLLIFYFSLTRSSA